MTTDEPLAMPPTASRSQGAPVFTLFVCGVALVFAGLCALAYWLLSGRVEARTAQLEGALVAVIAPITAHVSEVAAPEGTLVAQGQVIARLEADNWRIFEAEARALLPRMPSPQEGAARVAAAQSAEENITQRFALARHEETARQRIHEQAVLEHVRSELHMRGLDAGTRAISAQAREQAHHAETVARQRMEQARDAFEHASRGRVAVEQELRRLRYEWENARARGPTGPNGTTGTTGPTGTDSAIAPQAQRDPTLLRAPSAGRIVGSLAPGQLLVRGESALALAPADGAQIWVTAQVRRDQASALRPGLPCLVRAEGLDTLLYGTLHDLPAVESATTSSVGSAGIAVPLIRVRIRLLHIPSDSIAAHLPGRSAQVTIWARELPWLALLLPYIGPALALAP